MTRLKIVNRFDMELAGPPPERDSWFLDYVLRSPKQAGKHLTAGWLALQSLIEVVDLEAIDFVWEAFGGMGAQALMVQALFEPQMHVVNEYSLQAAIHLERVLPEDVHVTHGDSYASPNLGADLVMLDFGDLTVWKTRPGEQHHRLLDQVFFHQPEAVVFTDIACRYLHLHRERYETLLGEGACRSYETYMIALLHRIHELWGYVPVGSFFDRWSTVTALVPEHEHSGTWKLTPTPDLPLGLEIS